MMHKRKPFFIKGNFQLKFILCFMAILAVGTAIAVALIDRDLGEIVEEVVFSAHLSHQSSADIFRETILRTNLRIAGASVAIGILIIVGMYFYLEAFFHYVAKGLERMAGGDYSCRLPGGKINPGRELLDEYNGTAQAMAERTETARGLIGRLKTAVDSTSAPNLQDLKSLHKKLHF